MLSWSQFPLPPPSKRSRRVTVWRGVPHASDKLVLEMQLQPLQASVPCKVSSSLSRGWGGGNSPVARLPPPPLGHPLYQKWTRKGNSRAVAGR